MNNCSAKELNSTNHKKETAQNLLSIPLTINHSESIKRGEKRKRERERDKNAFRKTHRVDLEAITQRRYQSHAREGRKSGDPRLFNRRTTMRERDDGTIERATSKSARFRSRSSANAPIWTLQTVACCRWQPCDAHVRGFRSWRTSGRTANVQFVRAGIF